MSLNMLCHQPSRTVQNSQYFSAHVKIRTLNLNLVTKTLAGEVGVNSLHNLKSQYISVYIDYFYYIIILFIQKAGQFIHANLPFIKKAIPIKVLFIALGILNDEEIIDYMCFDSNDSEMLNIILSCIEEACTIRSQNVFYLFYFFFILNSFL